MNKNIKCLSWNCKGYRARSEDIRLLLRKERPHVLLLQETHLPPFNTIKIPGYNIYRVDPTPGTRQGGLATIVSQKLPCREIKVQSTLQTLVTSIGGAYPMTICNIYLECGQVIGQDQLDNLVPQLQTPFVLGGDFNAHNTLWGSHTSDVRGRMVDSFIQDWGLYLHNNNMPTFMDSRTGKSDAIDLILSSLAVSRNSEFRVLPDLYGSDHFPLCLSVNPQRLPPTPTKRWSFKRADWDAFSSWLTRIPRFVPTDQGDPVEELHQFILTSILSASRHTIPRVASEGSRPLLPWWNNACQTVVKERRKALRLFQKNSTEINLINYRKARARCKYVIKEAKRLSWRKYVSTINKFTPSSDVWRKVKTLKGTGKRSLPILKVGNGYEADPQRVAEIFASHFATVSSNESYSQQFQAAKRKAEETAILFDSTEAVNYPYNNEFSYWELDTAINSLKLTAPGPDQIHNAMIKHLPTSFRCYLLTLYNLLWTTNRYPDSWRDATLLPLLKPGKDSAAPESYRPIAMTNTLGKLLEKMVNARLMWELESRGLLSKYQSGFRKNRSTLDNLTRLVTYIQDGFVQGKETLGVFFDCEKAYDKTWRYLILQQLHKFGFKGHLPNFIQNFLALRRFQVKVGDNLSSYRIQENGVPQGAILSVTLFIIAVNDIPSLLPGCVEPFMFVDDMTVLFRGKTWPSVAPVLQIAINKLNKWATANGFSFSQTKTQSILFSRKHNTPNLLPLTIDGHPIPTVNTIRYLGLILDSKLNWKSHLDTVKAKCLNDLNLMRMIQSHGWGADRSTLLLIYHQLTRSKLDYGCPIYGSAKERHLKALDSVHNAFIRLATGAFRSSPIDSLLAESNEPPLASRRDLLLWRLGCKMIRFPENPASKFFQPPKFSHLYERKLHLPKPPGVRFTLLVNSMRLPESASPTPFSLTKLPPWTTPRPNIKYLGKSQLKAHTLVDQYIQEYRKHRSMHADTEAFFTDASNNSFGSGCAFVYADFSKVYSFNQWSSVTTIELEAIHHALQHAVHLKLTKVLVYTDSRSSLLSLNKLYTQNEVVAKIRSCVSQGGLDVRFCWVPSHIGIPGNERADTLAKEAIAAGEKRSTVITTKDLDRAIKQAILRRWQQQWTQSSNTKLKYVKPIISTWGTSSRRCRREEVVLARLRIGHTRLTHGYLMAKQDRPICALCGQEMTVFHFLCECPRLDSTRQHLQIATSMAEILQDNESTTTILFQYLKEIDVFNEI